jgi:pimeloyl-ACP methyl ester carboxylesterase
MSRRTSFLTTSVAALVVTAATSTACSSPQPPAAPTPTAAAAAAGDAIRPFHINIPEQDLVDLRARITATRWPARETVSDQSQGVQLAKIQDLVHYWGTEYDWRKIETKLNALPQFVTRIDGLDIQFVHIRSRHPNAMPLIITHGWPGSVLELLKVIGPLTDPTAYGGRAEDAFDLVLPSIPGYGFSGKPQGTGWGPDRIARAWAVLMDRLGYKHYVSQGGDWGSVISDAMARQAPPGLLGIHVNMPATVPADVAKALTDGEQAPVGLSDKERAAFDSLDGGGEQDRHRFHHPESGPPGVCADPATAAPSAREIPRAAATTAGANRRALSTFAEMMMDSAATTSPPGPRIGAATEVATSRICRSQIA